MKTVSGKGSETPFVSIVIPTHKKYPHFKDDKLVLKKMIGEAETRMLGMYGKGIVDNVVLSLNRMKSDIDFTHLQNGLVIHYSPTVQKIYHLPFSPSEKLIIDRSLEIRDVLYSIKNSKDYFVLVLSENRVRIINVHEGIADELKIDEFPRGKNDTGGKGTSRVMNYSSDSSTQHNTDNKAYDEVKVAKYLRDIDAVISEQDELKDLSMVIFAPVKLAAHFKKITKNSDRIIGFVRGNHEKKSMKDILADSATVIDAYGSKKQNRILALAEKENKRKRLSWGIRDINRCAMEGRGHLLIVEKDYRQSALKTESIEVKNKITDKVDDIIEMVLEKGGDVEFVDNGKLTEYGKMVLIKRY